MSKALTVLFVVLCLLASALAGDKPASTNNISPYLLIQQTSLSTAKAANYGDLVRQYKNVAASLNGNDFWIAATGITGNSNEVVYITPFANFADMDKVYQSFEKTWLAAKAKDAALISQFGEAENISKATIWHYVPELSYMPEKADIPHATHWMIYTIHLKPGMRSVFADFVKERMDLARKANLTTPLLTYDSVAGTSPAMNLMVPLSTLADLDMENSEALKAVMTPLIREHLDAIVSKSVASIDSQLFRMKPELSRPHPDLVAANPNFWTPKEPVALAEKKIKKAKKAEMDVGK